MVVVVVVVGVAVAVAAAVVVVVVVVVAVAVAVGVGLVVAGAGVVAVAVGVKMTYLAKAHANCSPDWWTPKGWLRWIEKTIGEDYFDPCPHDWDGTYDGLTADWPYGQPVYCNHPGSRKSTTWWWPKFTKELLRSPGRRPCIWAAFSVEQLRHMMPKCQMLGGYLVFPDTRVSWIWGGPDTETRQHGQPCNSPAQWSVFWSSARPAETPVPSTIMQTGGLVWRG